LKTVQDLRREAAAQPGTPFREQSGRPALQLSGKTARRLVYVDAYPDDHIGRPAVFCGEGGLRQDPADLFPVDKDVVHPLDPRIRAAECPDRLAGGDGGQRGKQRGPFGAQRGT
jgi:hypothetical protein